MGNQSEFPAHLSQTIGLYRYSRTNLQSSCGTLIVRIEVKILDDEVSEILALYVLNIPRCFNLKQRAKYSMAGSNLKTFYT